MIRTILVALDHSSRAPAVLALATEVAERFDASLLLLRAIHLPQEFPAAAHQTHPDPLPAHLHREAEQELEALAAGNARVRRPFLVSERPSWQAILDTAEAQKVDLIVLGGHSHGWLERLFGTVPDRVSALARCHVLVAHAE